MADDVRRTHAVSAYVGEDFLYLLESGRIFLEIKCCSLGIAVNRREWLIELVRDRRGHHINGRGAVQMCQFEEMAPRIGFGETASPPFNQQTGNHQSLRKQDGHRGNCLPAVLVPEGRRAKAYIAILR